MGRLKERRIVQSRIYLDGKQEPIPVYDYDYTYPKTVYDAIRKTFDDDSTTLTEEINAIYRLIAEKQPILSGGGAGKLMTWSGIDGVVGETEIIKTINREPNARSHSKVPSERAVGEIMDTKVSAATFEAHVRDKDIHITEEERDKWNSMAPAQDFNHHITDQFVHITMDERESWNKKADQSDLNEHILDINNPHNVTAHQVGTYSRKEIDEMIKEIRDSFFNYKNIEYDDRTNTAVLVEYESVNWNPNYVLAHGDELPEVTDPTLTYFALKPATDYSTDETQDCIIYVKKPGLVWQEVGVQEMKPGDLVIRYYDTQMYVWMQGRFINLFDGSAADDEGGDAGESILMWRPIISSDGILTWTRSTEVTAPDPMTIRGPQGYSPIKGVDYFDGADGEGVPDGGTANDILVKVSDDDFDTVWKSLTDVLGDYILAGGGLPDGIVNWDSINGRPKWYDETGTNSDGFITQRAATEQIDLLKDRIQQIIVDLGDIAVVRNRLNDHLNDYNNPHRVTPEQIGAVSNSLFLEHISNFNNPHNVTLEQLGIPNVDNTSDKDKPISDATQEAIDRIKRQLNLLQEDVGNNNFVANVSWEDSTCTITFNYRDGTEFDLEIPIIPIFKSLYFDDVNSELVLILPNADEHRINIKRLVTKYLGVNSKNIKVDVDTDGNIKATIIPDTITGDDIIASVNLRESPTTTTQPVGDRSVRIATTEFVKSIVIDNLISYETDRPLSANMGRILNQKKADVEDVLQIIHDMSGIDVIDHLESSNEIAALSANMGRYLNLTKAPKVHTSPSGSTFGRATVDLFGHTRSTNVDPLMDGIPFVGTDDGYYARGDHRHPTDTTRAPMHWPDEAHNQYEFTGEPKTPTPPDDSNDHCIANTEWIRRNAIGVIKGDCYSNGNESHKVATLRSTYMNPVVFMRQIGSTVSIMFKNEDKSGGRDNPTYLNVNETGDAEVRFGGKTLTDAMIGKNHEHMFVFDGERWQLINPVPGTGQSDISFGPGKPEIDPDDPDEETIINRMAGYSAFTVSVNGADEHGQVEYVWVAIPYPPMRDMNFTINVSKEKNVFAVKMGDGTMIKINEPEVIERTESNAVVQFKLDTPYPANSPCQLVYRSSRAWIELKTD